MIIVITVKAFCTLEYNLPYLTLPIIILAFYLKKYLKPIHCTQGV